MKKRRNIEELTGVFGGFDVVELEDEHLEDVTGAETNCGCSDGANCVCHDCELNLWPGCEGTELE